MGVARYAPAGAGLPVGPRSGTGRQEWPDLGLSTDISTVLLLGAGSHFAF